MRKKIFKSLVIFSVISLATILILIAFDAIKPTALYLQYISLILLAILGFSLNFSFQKLTNFDEAIACISRAVKSIEKLSAVSKATRYVKVLGISSQLSNAITYIEDIIATFELYTLRYDKENLTKIKARYDNANDNNFAIEKEVALKDIDTLKSIQDALKKYKKIN